jgi:hypothetical protein
MDKIGQLYVFQVTCMRNLNKIYRVVYELWIYFTTKTLHLEGLIFRNEETLNNRNIIIIKNFFLLLIVEKQIITFR